MSLADGVEALLGRVDALILELQPPKYDLDADADAGNGFHGLPQHPHLGQQLG